MNEYLSEALVLDKETSGDTDVRVSLFTKKFGKLVARTKSARLIVSKLSPHLNPGNIVRARVVEKRGLQVVDALKQRSVNVSPGNLHFLNQMISEAEPDLRLWQAIASEHFDLVHVLEILGWNPREAPCVQCAAERPAFFSIRKQELFCGACASKIGVRGLLYIGN